MNDNVDEVASLHMAQGSSLNINGPRVKTDLRNLTAAGNCGGLDGESGTRNKRRETEREI